MDQRTIAGTLVLACLLLGACGDGTGPDDDDEPCLPETTSVEASVETGSTVTFDWSPACGVAMLLIEPDGGASDQWGIATDEDDWDTPDLANRIFPPVTYGVVPSGGAATEIQPPETLVPGTSYELILWRVVPEAAGEACIARFDEACLIALESFTR